MTMVVQYVTSLLAEVFDKHQNESIYIILYSMPVAKKKLSVFSLLLIEMFSWKALTESMRDEFVDFVLHRRK